jgi:multidrug efflux system membrane fusion protein
VASSAAPVTVASVIQKDIPVQLRVVGNVQAYAAITVKPLVGGELSQVHFTEGQDVKKGDPLFTIDPRPYETALKQAEANLARDIAQVGQVEADLAKNMALVEQTEANLDKDITQAQNARADAERYASLIEKQVVSRQQYDQFRTNAEALEATVRADKAAKNSAEAAVRSSKAALENAKAVVRADRAALENSKIQLGYCFIRSPMDGRTGNVNVKRGTIIAAVGQSNTPDLVTINQISPIYVTFSVPEQNLSRIRKLMAAGKLKVEAFSLDDEKVQEGNLTFVDNAVDATTGTIQLKGTFDNREKRLWPGQFVRVVLTLMTQPGAIIVPSHAIQNGQEGQYVFVVKPDLTVESRPVTVDRSLGGEAVIEKGLQPGEIVVTEGQLRLVPGAKVEIKNPPGAAGKSS